jgi:predicted O-methyltransferase YrrM
MNTKNISDIPGFFYFIETYKRLASRIDPGGLFVEIGCFEGASTAWMADRLRSIPGASLVSIDSFPPEWKMEYKTPIRNLAACGMLRYCNLVVMDSVEAADLFRDGSVAVLFIDGGHSYEQAKADIAAWLPKMLPGGTMAGHDYASGWPGVIQAVDEAFGKDGVEHTTDECWIRRL